MKPGCLPDSLTHIVFGRRFNQPLAPGVLPAHLVKLKFGYNMCDNNSYIFDHETYGSKFNQPLNLDTLPNSLTHLCFAFRSSFDQPIATRTMISETNARNCLNILFSNDYRLYLCEAKYPDVQTWIYGSLNSSTIRNTATNIDTKQFIF